MIWCLEHRGRQRDPGPELQIRGSAYLSVQPSAAFHASWGGEGAVAAVTGGDVATATLMQGPGRNDRSNGTYLAVMMAKSADFADLAILLCAAYLWPDTMFQMNLSNTRIRVFDVHS